MTNTTSRITPHEIIFSLDIGTRNVVGIIAKKEDEQFTIIDVEIMEHPSRAMYDGQIHDIEKVAFVANRVKENLEKRLGFSLKQVAIAAAGRALKTYRVTVDREMDYTKEIDKSTIDSLELEGIQKAQEMLEAEDENRNLQYYCVGYTVVNYFLNGGVITSLKGHRGNRIGADVLATFLPHVVVNSLYTVMDRVGLEVINLTLEPIAAIQAAIPPKLRLLNLALIDIGAGTSDIALTREGTVVAYAMASVAGDEITEAIAKSFLLDFDSAEKLKLALNCKESHTFNDIVGISYTMTTEEIIEKIGDVIENLAKEIAEKIVEFNGKSPSAVFCIGGGSQIPTLTKHLSEKLGLPKERVIVRGTDIIENLVFQCDKLAGPEFITPIGIGIVAYKDRDQDFLQATVNGKNIKLFNTKQLLVSDALILVGYNARRLIARRGKSLSFSLNGKKKTIFGGHGEPAQIYINGKLGSLDAKIRNGDRIKIEDAKDGSDAQAQVKDVIDQNISFRVDDLQLQSIYDIRSNGIAANLEKQVEENEDISFKESHTVADVLKRLSMDKEGFSVLVNGKKVDGDYIIVEGDIIVTERNEKIEEEEKHLQEVAIGQAEESSITVHVNNSPISIQKIGEKLIFIDIFKHYEFDRSRPKGILCLKLNGQRANYTDEIQDGDQIEIYWDKLL